MHERQFPAGIRLEFIDLVAANGVNAAHKIRLQHGRPLSRTHHLLSGGVNGVI